MRTPASGTVELEQENEQAAKVQRPQLEAAQVPKVRPSRVQETLAV